MNTARPAGLLDSFTKGGAGAIKAHIQIVPGDVKGFGNLFRFLAFQVNTFKHLPIGLGQSGHQAPKTLADHSGVLIGWCVWNLMLKHMKKVGADCISPVNVNDRSPKGLIKPRDHLFILTGLIRRLQRF